MRMGAAWRETSAHLLLRRLSRDLSRERDRLLLRLSLSLDLERLLERDRERERRGIVRRRLHWCCCRAADLLRP